MRLGLVLAVLGVAACGVQVPPALADKVEAGCPDLLEPEPVATITKGLEVTAVTHAGTGTCTVTVKDDGIVLSVGVTPAANEQAARREVADRCKGAERAGPDESCGQLRGDKNGITAWGAAGRWQVLVAVNDVPFSEDVDEAVFELLAKVRASDLVRQARTSAAGESSFPAR